MSERKIVPDTEPLVHLCGRPPSDGKPGVTSCGLVGVSPVAAGPEAVKRATCPGCLTAWAAASA